MKVLDIVAGAKMLWPILHILVMIWAVVVPLFIVRSLYVWFFGKPAGGTDIDELIDALVDEAAHSKKPV